MKSMTGYGRGESRHGPFGVTVEVSAVNRRQAEVAVLLPRELDALENRLREEAAKKVSRGRLTIRVNLELQPDAEVSWRVQRPLARAYVRELRRLAKELGIAGEVSLEMVARAPGVLQADERPADVERCWLVVKEALVRALDGMNAMREREGVTLAKDLSRRIELLRRSVRRVEKRSPAVQKQYHQTLLERVRRAGVPGVTLEDERLLKEVVLFADRCDVSEELARLNSHFQQFEEACRSKEPVGRTLDFLAQEMNREINTLGSKANDASISREVVILKTELERFREQAQNIE